MATFLVAVLDVIGAVTVNVSESSIVELNASAAPTSCPPTVLGGILKKAVNSPIKLYPLKEMKRS